MDYSGWGSAWWFVVVCLGAARTERFSGTRISHGGQVTRMNADLRGFFFAKKSDSKGHGLNGLKKDLNGFFRKGTMLSQNSIY